MRSLRRKISKWKRHTSVQETSGSGSVFSDSEFTVSNKSVITVPRAAVKASKEDDNTSELNTPEEVRNDLLHLDAFFGELPSPKELKGFVTALESNSQHITRTKRLERALQRLNESLKEFEQTYASHHIGDVVVRNWDDESISMLMQEVTPGGLFGAAVAFGNAITETVTQKTELDGVVKQKRSILVGFVGKLLPLIKVLLIVGDAAAQTSACIPATVVLRGSLLIMEAAITARNCPKTLFSALESISYQADRLMNIRDTEMTASIIEASMELLGAIVKFYTACLVGFRQCFLVTAAKQLFRDDNQNYQSMIDDLNTAIHHFDQALWDQTRALILEVSKLPDFRLVKSPQDIFEWLSPSHWEVIGQLSNHRNRHFRGTLKWLYLIPELKAWLVYKEAPNVLWLTGLPGVGKSIIAAHLLSNLHSQLSATGQTETRRQTYLSYFFCKDGEQKLMRAQNLVQTISYQLALQNERFFQELNRTRSEEKFVISSSVGIRLLYNRLFQQPLSSLLSVGRHDIIYCVIDGLDEADFHVRDGRSGDSDVIILLKLLAKSPHLRILVLSRSVPQIREALLDLNSVTKDINTLVNQHDDIESYVTCKISGSSKLQNGFRRSGINVNPVTHMRDSANGNFLWVEVLLSFLEGCTSIKEFTSGLLQPPSQFQDLYKQLLRRVAANSTDQKRLVIREVIRIVVISAREMQVEELQAAIEAALDDQFFDFLDLLESECGTFLRIVDNPADVNRKQVQLVHETFRVFITTDASRGEEFHVSLPEAHANFAVILLQYLSQIDSELTDEKFGQWTSDVASNTERTYPLIKYAASQWSLHFRLAVGAQTIAESSCLAVTEFIQHGPLLRWIESLAIFKNLPVLSRTAEDLIAWVKNQTCSIQQTAIKLLRDWSIEIKHLYTEYGHIVADYPNSIHGILFDLFPQPSIFHSRYGNGLCSLFDGLPVPWNPTSVVNYDQNYDISTCSDEQKLLALASHSQIRVLDQTNGQSVQLLHPEDSSHADRWAVLAMTFGAKKNLLAAIHCPLPVADTVLYRPSISVWNIENQTLLITSPVDFQFQDTILLLDHFEFSQDTRSLQGGGWSFDIEKGILDSSRIQSLSPTFGHVEAVMFSPDGQSILKLEQGGQRTLTVAKTSSHVSFNRPAYYLSKSDHPSDIPSQYFKESFYGPRYSVAPFLWWQQWREITRSYQFSPDSRWFARFTDDNKVILHDLHNGSHKVIYSSVGRILANNITFDQKSRRLAWTFDYINLNNESRTRVELWSTETSSPIAGVPLGSRWRERVEFCWDPAHLLLYRADVSVWNIPLAMEGRLNKISQDKGTIGAYAPGVMRVGYTADGHIFVNYRCASCVDASGAAPFSLIYEGGWAGLWYIAEQWGWRLPRPVGQALSDCGPWCVTRHGPQCRPLLTTHVFRNDKRHQKVTYESPYAYSLHRHPAASHDNILAMGDTVVDISNPDRLSVGENILISRADNMDILSTAFHLSGQLMACLVTTPFQNLEDPNGFTLALQMYCTRKNEHLTSVTFSSSMPREAKYLGPFVLIDPSPVPNYFLVLLLETAFDDASSGSKPNQPTAESYGGLRVWVFDLPSLAQARSFKVPQYDYRSSCNVPATTMTYHFNSQLNKLICCEERRVPPNFCQLWIVDIERGIGTVQFLPVFRRLSFAQSMDTIVAMSVRGWIQSKTLEEMEGEMIKQPELEVFKGDIDLWVLEDWKRLAYIPRKFAPCFESVIAVHPSGRIAYVAEFASRLVEISFQW